MITRCSRAQWRGLTPSERKRIDDDWALVERGHSGIYYPSLGHDHYMIWEVEGPGHNGTSADQLISIKVDHYPGPNDPGLTREPLVIPSEVEEDPDSCQLS